MSTEKKYKSIKDIIYSSEFDYVDFIDDLTDNDRSKLNKKILLILNGRTDLFNFYCNDKTKNYILTVCIALYYLHKAKFDLVIKYCLMAIEKGNNHHAMVMLANYYDFNSGVANYYQLAEKYYLMAIENGNVKAMNDLAMYYYACRKISDAIYYYKMAIDNYYDFSMYLLGKHYKDNSKYELMKEYYYMAIEECNAYAMKSLASYFYDVEKNVELAIKYYLMSLSTYCPGYNNAIDKITRIKNYTDRITEYIKTHNVKYEKYFDLLLPKDKIIELFGNQDYSS